MKVFDLTKLTPEELVSQVQACGFESSFPLRDRLGLISEYVDWVKLGKKDTTVRFRKGRVDIPQRFVLPLHPTTLDSLLESPQAGWVQLTQLVVKRYSELSARDATRDGFSTVQDLKSALFHIYGRIDPNQLITIYTFRYFEQDGAASCALWHSG